MRSLALQSRWRRVCDQLGAVPGHGDALLATLVDRYSEPHRRYHNLDHIAEVLDWVTYLREAGEPVGDGCAVDLAAWFHDAVYTPGAPDNEQRSAELAIEMLGVAGVETGRLDQISELVLATEHHVPDGPDAALLVDADLAVLGRDRPGYLEYAAGIREEYRALDDAEFQRGRTSVLRQLLDRPLLYHTPTMRDLREQRARDNMSAELEDLMRGDQGDASVDATLRQSGA